MPGKKKKGGKKKKKAKKIVEDPKIVRALLSAAVQGNVDELTTYLHLENPKDKTYDLKAKAGMCIVHAAEHGHIDAVKTILEYGGLVEYQQGAPLRRASRSGELEMVRFLVELGADVNGEDEFTEQRAVHMAADKGHLDVLEFLCDHGADMKAPCHERNMGAKNGWAPLHFAADNGHISLCQLLLSKGVPMDQESTDGGTPLALAAERGHFDVVRFFVYNGANLHAKRRGLNPVQWAIYRCDAVAVQFLVSYGAKPNLDHRVMWFDKDETLQERMQREFDPLLWKRIDLAIYRGGKLLRTRACMRRIVGEVKWTVDPAYDRVTFDPAPDAENVSKLPPLSVQMICAYAGSGNAVDNMGLVEQVDSAFD